MNGFLRNPGSAWPGVTRIRQRSIFMEFTIAANFVYTEKSKDYNIYNENSVLT